MKPTQRIFIKTTFFCFHLYPADLILGDLKLVPLNPSYALCPGTKPSSHRHMNLYIRDQTFGSPSTEVPSSLTRDLDTAIPPSKDPGTNPSFPHNLDSGTSLITRFPSVTSPENLRYRGLLISIRIQSPRPQEGLTVGVLGFASPPKSRAWES